MAASLPEWLPAEGAPLAFGGNGNGNGNGSHAGLHKHFTSLGEARPEEPRFSALDMQRKAVPPAFDSLLIREGELMSKLHEILRSPLGAGAVRIVDELHVMVGRNKNLS